MASALPLNQPGDWWKVWKVRAWEGQLVSEDTEELPPRILATARAWQAAIAQEPDPGVFRELQIGEIIYLERDRIDPDALAGQSITERRR